MKSELSTEVFAELQCQGVQADRDGDTRRGGAGPSDARAFVIGSHVLMFPTLNSAARNSQYFFQDENGGGYLSVKGVRITEAHAVPRPRFYDLVTTDGIPYSKIAILHGRDCLASTVVQACVRYANPQTRCHFCGIGLSLANGKTILKKTPNQLAEVALVAKELDGITHVVLTTGTTDERNKGAEYLAECAGAIRRETGLPIQAQFEPPMDDEIFHYLRTVGVVNVGLHVESFDEAVRKRYTPGKSNIPLDDYFHSFERAVAVFGRNKVTSYVILGLGEEEFPTLEGCRRAAAMGVYPFVVPLRPMDGTFLADALPPAPDYVCRMAKAVGGLIQQHGLSGRESGAGCARCAACSLLQLTESPRGTGL